MRLIVVSNRLPVTVAVKDGEVSVRESVGGLATAMKTLLAATDGGRALGFDGVLWVGWPGLAGDALDPKISEALRSQGLEPVPLGRDEVEKFYEGFCNSTLWPLFHGFTTYTVYRDDFWDSYVSVNKKFADVLASVAKPDDYVWVHDYHFMLLPLYLRGQMPDLGVGFFLHIPFPPPEILQLMPSSWRNEILDGLLASDLVGFHTHEYSYNFVRSVVRFLGYGVELDVVKSRHGYTKVGVFPIGIDYERFHNSGADPQVAKEIEEVRRLLRGLKVVFSIDRLDYTKGVINRVYAWERFLKSRPEWRRKASFVLVVVPSRAGVPQYEAMKRQIDMEVGRINGELGELDWVPIIYLYRFLPTPTLLAMYNLADVALITPLKDGMNLVSKEYVASRRDCRGVLILSETAGAAKELTEAIIVNPNDVEGMAKAIEKALTMPEEEQCRRIQEMQRKLKAQDVVKWGVDFIQSLMGARLERAERERRLATAIPLEGEELDRMAAAYRSASVRLLFLDYDGTLVPLYPYAYQAVPDEELLHLLAELARQGGTYVVVVSGRPKDFLDSWFGKLPVYLIAEHGFWLKEPGGGWAPTARVDLSWKLKVRKVMEEFVERVPGTYIEEKESSIAWHYRNAELEAGERAALELADSLTAMLTGSGVVVMRGKKVVEVKPAGVSKGTAARSLVELKRPDFVLAAGDDETDETMFAALPQTAYTVKVGPGRSLAKYYLPNYKALRSVLRRLVESQH
ncbi:MAG: bifunctional alpha,alpha-trehalose-phosphate synthase (UDP-forming)/trehalose-phosphatase [Thermoproteus sp.]